MKVAPGRPRRPIGNVATPSPDCGTPSMPAKVAFETFMVIVRLRGARMALLNSLSVSVPIKEFAAPGSTSKPNLAVPRTL